MFFACGMSVFYGIMEKSATYKNENVTYKGENGTYQDESTAYRNTTHHEIAIRIMRTVPYIITKITCITEMFLH